MSWSSSSEYFPLEKRKIFLIVAKFMLISSLTWNFLVIKLTYLYLIASNSTLDNERLSEKLVRLERIIKSNILQIRRIIKLVALVLVVVGKWKLFLFSVNWIYCRNGETRGNRKSLQLRLPLSLLRRMSWVTGCSL